jgi:hypothetical protein
VTPTAGSRPRSPALTPWRLLLVLTLLIAGPAIASSYSYDVSLYNRYVSNGSWWTHSSMTNSTWSWVTWRVSFSTRSCTDLSGAVSLALDAKIAAQRSACTTTGRDMSTAVAPRSSAALKYRTVTHYDYYFIRKIDRYTLRTVDSGYATRKDTFNDYAFSSLY